MRIGERLAEREKERKFLLFSPTFPGTSEVVEEKACESIRLMIVKVKEKS